jgi:plasmid stabilization system protein ParE
MAEWSHKDERQYEHIRDSAENRGASEERAKEIAARTVNKRRREEGRTPNKTTQGTGNPNHALEDRSKQELYNQAKALDVEGLTVESFRLVTCVIKSCIQGVC